ncbi:MAG: hypothetical protein ACI9KE_006468 [Polyangiales bacterium]|jgi:hypothetical protein
MRTPAFFLSVLFACSSSPRAAMDGGSDAATDSASDSAIDVGEPCACLPGPHEDNIYLLSDGGEVWTFDPASGSFDFVVGPVCRGATPFSMAVDSQGRAFINLADSLDVVVLDLLSPGACEPASYVRTNPDFGLFGMSFASTSATDICSELYVMTYSGDGSFTEGPELGRLGRIDDEGELSVLAPVDFDGGELTGTGDGRLFAFAGDNPVKLVEYNIDTGLLLQTLPLDGVQKTNASAVAFFGGDIYIFIESVPAECETCMMRECGVSLGACRDDAVCNEHLECVLASTRFTDECGGGLSAEMMECLPRCDACLMPPRTRVSRVIRYDLDMSEGGGFTSLEGLAPIRVVGAASSPCVPVGPI